MIKKWCYFAHMDRIRKEYFRTPKRKNTTLVLKRYTLESHVPIPRKHKIGLAYADAKTIASEFSLMMIVVFVF